MGKIGIAFILLLYTLGNGIHAQQKFELYTGLSHSFRSINFDKSTPNLQEIQLISEGESSINSMNVGFRYRIIDKRNIGFKVGIEVNTPGFMDSPNETAVWPEYDTRDWFFCNTPRIEEQNMHVQRKFMYIDIPLALEIHHSYGKWTPNFQLEIIPEYLTSINYKIIYDFGDDVFKTKPKEYINRFNIAVGASFGSYYNITDKWSILLNCFYRRQLLNVLKSTTTTTLYAYGFNAGIAFSL